MFPYFLYRPAYFHLWSRVYFLAGCCRELDPIFTSVIKVIIWRGLSRAAGGREKGERAGKGEFSSR